MILKNSLSGKLEEFTPIDSDNIRMYVCGPTIYNSPHIGNTRSIVIFDLLYRILKFLYPKVTYVRNITDVDDKIIRKAKELKEPIATLTTRVLKDFNEDIESMNILRPTYEPKATEHIQDMIHMIQHLIEKDFAYFANKHILFRVNKDFDYGCLSKRSIKDMIPGKRVEPAPFKENPLDFVLWKPSYNPNAGWESPWGFGRPGWHIECSAMSNKYLGNKFDIHGGGQDLIFPHHENEIAQTRCFSGNSVMANYWVHNGMLTVNGFKMSKSKGNVLFIKDAIKEYSPDIIRYFFYSSHYSKDCNWSNENLKAAETNVKNMINAIQGIEIIDSALQNNSELMEKISSAKEAIDPEFLSALTNDMNTPLALHRLTEIVKMISKEKSEKRKIELQFILKQSANLIGITLQNKEKELNISEQEILSLIEKRSIAKKNKDFSLADEIRNNLSKNGILLEDTNSGTIWKKI